MYVRVSDKSGQAQPRYSYRFSSHFGSDLAENETLVERLRSIWKVLTDKDRVFELLRRQERYPLGSSVISALRSIFAQRSDDLWLAEALAWHGPEPLWPLALIKERVRRVKSDQWRREPGDIEAILPDPDPDPPGLSMPPEVPPDIVRCYDMTRSALENHPVRAYFFPGRTERRALIISGVHGNEPSGVEVVQRLRTELAKRSAGGDRPDFTTILVPLVFPRTQETGARNVRGGIGLDWRTIERRRVLTVVCHDVEPNWNFPLPGESYAIARARGAGGSR